MGKERKALLAPWGGSNAGRSLHHPFPSLLVKGEDAAAPVQSGLTPQCSWALPYHSCISPGRVLLLDEGSPSTASFE